MVQFKPATKTAAKLRLALAGPAGSGKTYSALAVGTALGGRVAVVDTEHGSASKYSDVFQFDTLELDSFHPERYIEAIAAAEQAGFDVLVIDSLSHAWMGKDGALELVDRAAKRSQSGNSFTAWRDVTPLHNQLVEAMLAARLHLIVTLRSKQEYVQEKDDRGKTLIRKVGMAPVQRDGLEYEFDVFGDLDSQNNLLVGKSRCSALTGKVISRPGAPLAATLSEWLVGAPAVAPDREGASGPGVLPSPQPVAPVRPVPLREREVNDRPRPVPTQPVAMVSNADNAIWKRWLELLSKAQDLGIPVEEITLPIERAELERRGIAVAEAIHIQEALLVSAARMAGQP